jgi:flagellar hook-basal body complex protein FliE
MDPLSAYRVAASAARPVQAPNAPEDGFAKIIPKGELDKLSSSVLQPGGIVPNLTPPGAAGENNFSGIFGNMVKEVSARQAAASDSMNQVMSGGNMPLHQAMITVQEASVSFQLLVEVRNKLLESYQELMRMQV